MRACLERPADCAEGSPAPPGVQVEDSAVLRFPRAVTHFSPGSHRWRPQQRSSLPGVYVAGDWVKGVDHGANGLSQARGRGGAG